MMLHCPNCHSNQLKAIEDGMTNPLLEKGIQFFAGTLRNNKILLICRSCSHSFKLGEGVLKSSPDSLSHNTQTDVDHLILQTINEKGLLTTIKTYKSLTGVTLAAAKKKIDKIAKANGIDTKTKTPIGCYIIALLIAFIIYGIVQGIINAFK